MKARKTKDDVDWQKLPKGFRLGIPRPTKVVIDIKKYNRKKLPKLGI